jgi:formate hydrogenlyase transcriptional activator
MVTGIGSARAVLPVLLDVVRAVTERRELTLSELLKETAARVLPADYFGGLVLGQGSMAFSQLFLVPPVDLPSPNARDYFGVKVIETRRVLRFTRADLGAFPLQAALWDRLGVQAGLTIPLLAEARTLGTLSYWSKDVHRYEDADLEILAVLGRAMGVAIDNHLAFERLEQARAQAASDYSSLVADVRGHQGRQDLIGRCAAFRAVQQQVALVGPTGSTVLITGESGTGKELVARAVHAAGPRREQPFVAINCAALPTSLAESELFGHEEGAFTGAIKRRRGRFELAQGGTLFLDEIGELPLETQAKLLRALQERRIERVGGHESLAVDVRIVAATNRDLARMVAEKRFREDLYYRLSVFPLYLPPLRERKEDIPLLVDFFIARAAERLRVPVRALDAAGLTRLVDYDWPGNVRELQNAIERAMIVSQGGKLDVEAVLPAPVLSARKQATPAGAAVPPAGDDREAALKLEYRLALDDCQWVIEGPAGAAARLGVHPNTLRYRLKRLGLARPAR